MTASMQPAPVRLRQATVADADALARGIIEGVEDYPAFAPPGWRAPPLADEIAHLAHLLDGGRAWCLVAECDGAIVGQITLLPGHAAPHPVGGGELVHVSNLFVRRDHWGGGLARTLLGAAVERAREEGYEAMRLFVATGQARARRFYEREGWRPVGDPFHDPAPGLTLLEYRRLVE